ncbi:hypothetical protein FACS1894217_04770 [Clostridia bacterium]|nr:hypothetical protein FACS1894217_04770 [Clostridia bacterium]
MAKADGAGGSSGTPPSGNKKRYNSHAMAVILDLSERRVRQLRDEGILKEDSRLVGMYELVPNVRAYVRFLRNGDAAGDGTGKVDYNTERALLMRAKRQREEFDLRLRAGELHETADIENTFMSALANFKSRLMGIPSKLSPILSKKTDKTEIYRIIKAATDEALNEMSHFGDTLREGKDVERSDTKNADESI